MSSPSDSGIAVVNLRSILRTHGSISAADARRSNSAAKRTYHDNSERQMLSNPVVGMRSRLTNERQNVVTASNEAERGGRATPTARSDVTWSGTALHEVWVRERVR